MPFEGPNYAKTLGGLRDMSDEELIASHDAMINTGNYVVGLDYYLRELARREQDRQTRTMVRLTWVIGVLTAINVAVVVVSSL